MDNGPSEYQPPPQGTVWPPPPEGAPPPAYPYPPYGPLFRPLTKLAQLNIVAIVVVTAVQCIGNIVDTITTGMPSTVVALLSVPVSLTAFILFLMWIYRAYGNLPALDSVRTKSSPGWAVAYYFIPILSLYKPYQIVAEMFQRSDPDPSIRVTPGSTPVVGLWWGTYLASIGTSWIEAAATSGKSGPATFGPATIDMVVNVISAWFACQVIIQLTARMHARNEALMGSNAVGQPQYYA